MNLLAAVVPALLGSAAAISFVPPFDSKSGFELKGNAEVAGNAVVLAQKPGQSGAVWTTAPVVGEEWTLEASLRSKADLSTEVGSSGFTLWYTAKPNSLGPVHGGADKWDGLAVMIDSVGKAQSIRGHLSDGSYSFGGDVEADALSLCRIDYRNAAVPIALRVGYSHEGFVVDVNGVKCFMTTEMTLPSGYFGVSANSDTSGDVLSVERLEVSSGMKPDLAAHLPQHAGERGSVSKTEAAGQVAAADTQAKQESRAGQAGQAGLDPAAMQAAINPVMSRLEFVDQKLARLDSVVNQLVDTLSLSLAQVSGDRSAQVSEADPAVQKELQAIRSQISELRKASQQSASSSELGAPAAGPSIWTIVVVVMAVQLVAVFVHNSLSKRRQRHEKLI